MDGPGRGLLAALFSNKLIRTANEHKMHESREKGVISRAVLPCAIRISGPER